VVCISASVISLWRQGSCFPSHVDVHGAGSRSFGVTGRGGAGDSLTTDIGGDRVETVLDGPEGVECDTDWKALLARCTWSILHAALYNASGSVSTGRLYVMVAIWFWMPNLRPRQNFTTSVWGSV